jgi:hypothetical protein
MKKKILKKGGGVMNDAKAPLWFTRAFDLLDKRFEAIEKRLDEMDERFEKAMHHIDQRFNECITREEFNERMSEFLTREEFNERMSEFLTREEFNERMDNYPTKDFLLKVLDRHAGLIKKREIKDVLVDGTLQRHEEDIHECKKRISVLESATS